MLPAIAYKTSGWTLVALTNGATLSSQPLLIRCSAGYQNASKCYVYLSDVSISGSIKNDQSSQGTWEPAFQKSRWFTRGWTLQELIAPASVKFFSLEGKRLGDKKSLERQVHEITGIAIQAL